MLGAGDYSALAFLMFLKTCREKFISEPVYKTTYKSCTYHTANYSTILFSKPEILQHPERQQSAKWEHFLIPSLLLLFILKTLPLLHPGFFATPTKGISKSQVFALMSARRQVNLCKSADLMTPRSILTSKPETINLLRHSSCCLLKWQLQFS